MGWSGAEDGGGATFLPREEWAKPRGRKSNRRRCGSGDRGAAVLWPDQPIRGRGSRAKTASSGEVVANLKGPVNSARRRNRRCADWNLCRLRGTSALGDIWPKAVPTRERRKSCWLVFATSNI